MSVLVYKMINNEAPHVLKKYLKDLNYTTNTRGKANNNFFVTSATTKLKQNSSLRNCINIWNKLPNQIKAAPSWHIFKNRVYKHFLSLN